MQLILNILVNLYFGGKSEFHQRSVISYTDTPRTGGMTLLVLNSLQFSSASTSKKQHDFRFQLTEKMCACCTCTSGDSSLIHIHAFVGSMKHNSYKLWTHTQWVHTNICMMAHQHAVCSVALTEPLRRVNLPSKLFKRLQFRSISKIYEFGSRQITHPLISALSLSQRGRRRGGGCFPLLMSVDKHGGWRTRLSANHAL